jgi:hypothetical protein
MDEASAGKRTWRWLWLGVALLAGGLLAVVGSSGSCASDTQPHPSGWPFGVAPRSWTGFLLFLGLGGFVLAAVGAILLLCVTVILIERASDRHAAK